MCVRERKGSHTVSAHVEKLNKLEMKCFIHKYVNISHPFYMLYVIVNICAVSMMSSTKNVHKMHYCILNIMSHSPYSTRLYMPIQFITAFAATEL